MAQFKGYLINSKQIINFGKWYLQNPLHTQFPWMYHANDFKFVKKLIKKAQNNPKLLLFGNQLSQLVSTYTIPSATTTATDVNDGTKTDNGTTVSQYIHNLKEQTLVPYSQVKEIARKYEIKFNHEAKAKHDKLNAPAIKINKKYDKELADDVDMYKNNNSQYSQSAKDFDYGQYLGNKEFYVDVSDGVHLTNSVVPLLDKSSKLFPKHAKLNRALKIAFAHLQEKYLDTCFKKRHGFVYVRTHRFIYTKLDIFEVVAWLLLHKRNVMQKFEPSKIIVPNAPAFKKDLNKDNFLWDKHANNTPDYLSDMNKVADYIRLKKHEI